MAALTAAISSSVSTALSVWRLSLVVHLELEAWPALLPCPMLMTVSKERLPERRLLTRLTWLLWLRRSSAACKARTKFRSALWWDEEAWNKPWSCAWPRGNCGS